MERQTLQRARRRCLAAAAADRPIGRAAGRDHGRLCRRLGGHFWIWLALAIFVGVGLAMTPLTPLAEARLHQMRRAAGLGIESPFGISRRGEPHPADPDELQRLLAAWNPMPMSVLGFASFTAILALMLLKPF